MKSRTRWLRAAQISAFFLAFCFGFWALWGSFATGLRTKSIFKQIYMLYQACFAFAQGNNKEFPDGKSANEAFRKLFEKGLVDDERLLWIPPINSTPAASIPDGIISDSTGNVDKAVEPGECCFYYVRPSPSEGDTPNRPLIFTRVGGQNGKVYDFAVTATGNALALPPSDSTIPVAKMISKTYGIDPKDILEPDGPLPRTWEIPAPILSTWKGVICGLLLAIGIFLHRWSKRLTKSVTATESAA